MTTYRAHVDSLPYTIGKGTVHYFDGDLLEDVYAKFFNFCVNDLARDDRWKDWDVARCGFFFRKEDEINAAAVTDGKHIWIEVNDYFVKDLYQKFMSFANYLNSEPEGVLIAKTLPKEQLWYSMFTTVTIFLYYHELGHIIQYDKSSPTPAKVVTPEKSAATGQGGFDIMRHVKEYDSDEFAANFTYDQIAGNFDLLKEHQKTREMLMAMFSSSIAAIFFLFDILSSGFELPIHYEETTHPHGTIRAAAVTGLMLGKLETEYGAKYKISKEDVLRRAFEMAFQLIGPGDSHENFFEALKTEKTKIVQYSGKLKGIRDSHPWMAGVRLKNR